MAAYFNHLYDVSACYCKTLYDYRIATSPIVNILRNPLGNTQCNERANASSSQVDVMDITSSSCSCQSVCSRSHKKSTIDGKYLLLN